MKNCVNIKVDVKYRKYEDGIAVEHKFHIVTPKKRFNKYKQLFLDLLHSNSVI